MPKYKIKKYYFYLIILKWFLLVAILGIISFYISFKFFENSKPEPMAPKYSKEVDISDINKNTIASGGTDGYIHIWSINSGVGRRITTYSPVYSLQLMSSNSSRLIAGLYQVIHIYDTILL